MDTRQAIHPAHARTLDTEGLRREFLIPEVFRPGELTMTYSQIDRIVVGGIMPLAAPVGLPGGIGKTFGVDYFLQRREMGIINIGGPAKHLHRRGEDRARFAGGAVCRHGCARVDVQQLRSGQSGEILL